MPKSKKASPKRTPSHAHSYLVLSDNRMKLQFLVIALFTLTAFLLYFVVTQDQNGNSLKNSGTSIVTAGKK